MKKSYFVTVALTSGTLYGLFELGFLNYMWNADVSKLSFVILVLLWAGLLVGGRILFLQHNAASYIKEELNKKTARLIDIGYEISNNCLNIGMLGTVIGFINMTMALANAKINDISGVKSLIKITTNGLSTALLTTAVGLIASIILGVIFFTIEKKYEKT